MATTALQLCRFCARTDIASREHRAGVLAFRGRKPLSVKCSGDGSPSGVSVAVDSEFDSKKFRHDLTRSKNYNRKGFGHKEETLELMNQEYTSNFFVFLNWILLI